MLWPYEYVCCMGTYSQEKEEKRKDRNEVSRRHKNGFMRFKNENHIDKSFIYLNLGTTAQQKH